MNYRAVGYRLAVDIDSLELPIPRGVILSILDKKGFKIIHVDVVALAQKCIGATYRRGARLAEAPLVLDCSSFIKWLYGQCGIWLPRRSIQQREVGESIELSHVASGDVVFVSGSINYYFHDPADGVGHVGIATGNKSVIHAANSKVGIVETSFDAFVNENKFRGARRYIPINHEITIFETPMVREVEIEDDIRWIVMQSLSK